MQMKNPDLLASNGFALIDSLVALVIVGIMTVGFSNAWLQFQRTTQLTQMRQTAHALLDELAQNLLLHDARFGTASRITHTTGDLPSGDAPPAIACRDVACDAGEFSHATLQAWAYAVKSALPSATLTVTVESGWQRWEIAWPQNLSATSAESVESPLTRVSMWL